MQAPPGRAPLYRCGVHIDAVELVRVQVQLVAPFRASYGVQHVRDVLLVHVFGDGVDGWGEDVAPAEPLYVAEHIDASHLTLRDHLLPRLGDAVDVETLAQRLHAVRGWSMAKCALEAAILDAECRLDSISLARRLGVTRDRIEVGVSVGLKPSIAETLDEVDRHLQAGYRRIKLKIAPGNDLELVAAVRRHAGDAVPMQVDGNGAYQLDDAEHLARLDEYGLLLIEQPLPEDDLAGHARLAERVRTPICLDESITSARRASEAIEMGACTVVSVKPAHVGGYMEAARVHDVCVAAGVPAWVGGMLETGVGRAANLALAALPGFTLWPDVSASDRYFADDLTPPFVLRGGTLAVPAGAGIGVVPRPEVLVALGATTERIELR